MADALSFLARRSLSSPSFGNVKGKVPEETEMAYTITMAVLALLAQAAGPAEKSAVDPKSPDAARRLLQNGRYAEAEEAYLAVESEAKKQKGGLTPRLEVTLTMGKAECQASQGEYGKAIELLKSLAGRQPKNADVTARLAELHFIRGDWDVGRRGGQADPGRQRGPSAGTVDRSLLARVAREARGRGQRLQMVR